MDSKMVVTTVNGVPTGELIEGQVTVRHGEPSVVERFERYWQGRIRYAELMRDGIDCEIWIGDRITDSWSKSYDDYVEDTFLLTEDPEKPL